MARRDGFRAWQRPRPLRLHLAALLLAAVLPLALFAATLIVLDARKERAAVELRMTTNASQLASAVDAELQRTTAMLEVLGRSGSLARGDLRGFHEFAGSLVRAEPAWTNVHLLDAKGELLLDAQLPFGTIQPELKRNDVAAEALHTGRPLVSELPRPAADARDGGAAVLLPLQLGPERYVLAAHIDPAHWRKQLESRLPPDMEAVLLDAGGRAIASSSAPALPTPGDRTGSQSASHGTRAPMIPTGQRLTIDWVASGGVHRIDLNGATTYVAGSRALLSPWTVVTVTPAEWLEGPLRRSGIALAGAFVAALSLGLLLAASLGTSLAKSISSLVEGVEAVVAGRSPDVRRHRVAELARARESLMRAAESMSAQLRREEELRARLEAHEAARNAFLGVLGHELRNPLAPLQNCVAILKRVGGDSPPVRKATAVLERQTRQLGRLVDDLLDVTRIERGKIELRKEPVDLAHIVRNVVADQEAGARDAGITLEPQLPSTPVIVYGDPARMTQAIGNLLNNACKFTPRGGTIRVALEVSQDVARVRVKDNGAGIDAAVLRHIFEPFVQGPQQGARVAGGLGLGLALVRALARMHGGSVSAASDGLGQGAEFVIELPLDHGTSAATPAQPQTSGASGHAVQEDRSSAAQEPASQRKVLIVDDDVDGAQTMGQLVDALGHAAHVAHDVPAALALCQQQVPDIVLCDLSLPGADGYSLARQLRGDPRFARTRLVVVSGYAMPEHRAESARAGFHLHLSKPVNLEQLQRVLDAGGASVASAT